LTSKSCSEKLVLYLRKQCFLFGAKIAAVFSNYLAMLSKNRLPANALYRRPTSMVFEFDVCRLVEERREFWRSGKIVPVEPQVFDLLVFLLRNNARVVSKDELLAAVWSGRIVSESTMTSRINAARTAVGDTGHQQRLIRTIARKGFRFVGMVTVSGGGATEEDHVATTVNLPDKPSIAVLPFTNMSGDLEQEYFSDGISEEIITALSRLRWFFVISRNSTFVYKGRPHDVRRVGSELGVRYVLEGSVRKSGLRLRVTSQLLDATTGNHIWSERYDCKVTEIFSMQDEITTSVVAAIEPKLLAAEGLRAAARNAKELDAWDRVARGLSHFWRFTKSDSAAAISNLRHAVANHPDYAPAHSMLACALLISSYVGWTSPGQERDLAASLACRAIALDDSDPWAHFGLGLVALMGRLPDDALRYFKSALAINPNFATAAGFVGFTLALDGQTGEALLHFERAMRISPRDPFNSLFLAGTAVAHYLDRNYGAAIQWARQAIQLRPEYIGAHRIFVASLAQDGQREAAAAALAVLQSLAPGISITLARLSVPYTARTVDRFVEGLRRAGMPE
jgi:TolB-like protein/Tfp pilus assembly protein PilF